MGEELATQDYTLLGSALMSTLKSTSSKEYLIRIFVPVTSFFIIVSTFNYTYVYLPENVVYQALPVLLQVRLFVFFLLILRNIVL